MKRDRSLETKVGLFLLVGLLLLGGMVFLIGSERHVFDRQVKLNTEFDDIAGLRVGAAVRLAGLDVGIVNSILMPLDLRDRKVHVQLKVRRSVLDRVRQDSVASIESAGLLGDKVIGITVGSADEPPVEDEGFLKSQASTDLLAIVGKADQVMDNLVSITAVVRDLAAGVKGSNVEGDVGRLIKNLADITGDIRTKKGLLHSLINDDGYQLRIYKALDDLAASAAGAKETLARIDQMLDVAQKGPGLVHALVYDPKGDRLLTELSSVVSQLDAVAVSARTQKSLLNRVLFEQPGEDPLGDLVKATADIRIITSQLRLGQGTIGGLLRDPTVYEDLKVILGDVRRNQLLKAVLRMAIEGRDEAPPSQRIAPQR